ncbi:MAG: type III pantothenate kinase [Methylophilaceae bacterium]|jgi:type III pantothenate kinase
MLIVIDIGNTRTKWAALTSDGRLSEMQVTPNKTLAQSALKKQLAEAEKVVIANVAGDATIGQLLDVIPKHVIATFVKATSEACHVINRYDSKKLGVDRWAAAVATWNQLKQPAIVVSAGTAITIDSIAVDSPFKLTLLNRVVSNKGVYLGGTIMPGLHTMQQALNDYTANLSSAAKGVVKTFPTNTADAMQTGCMNAAMGAILLQVKQLEKHCAFLPKVVITGGDAVKIAHALRMHVKRVVIAEDLVLQGLALLEKEQE